MQPSPSGTAVPVRYHDIAMSGRSSYEFQAHAPVARACRAAFALGLVLYCTLLATLSALKHATYHSSLIDLGIFDQVIWSTAHGAFFWDTLDPYVQHNHLFLGQHFSPGLIVLAPLYLVVPSVYTLLVVQTLALALGAVPLYALAVRRTGDERIALLLALAYLAYPALAYANLFDFHEIVLAVPLLSWALERLDADRPLAATTLLCLALLFKEEVGLIVAAFGAYIFLDTCGLRTTAGHENGRSTDRSRRRIGPPTAVGWQGRRRALGLAVAALGLGWTAGVVFIAVPHLRGGPYLFDARYQGGLLQHGSLHLAYLLHFLNPAKAGYFALLLLPLLGLPLLGGWALLLPLPTIAYTLLSTYPLQYDIHYHYAAPMLPLLFGAAVYALLRFPERLRVRVAGAVLALVILSAWLVGPLPGTRGFSASDYQMGPRERAMAALVAMVPPDASLAVDNQLGAHLTERRWVTHFFTGYEHAQALLFDLRETSATEAKRLRAVAAIVHDPSWRLVARRQDIVLYLRP